MKKIILMGAFIAIAGSGYLAYDAVLGKKCTGNKNCTACTNCSGCKHCAKNGGTCGVCK